jgi:uncharacterized protein with HEPN domain
MSRDEVMYLRDIVESCGRIRQYTQGLSRAGLIGDQKTYDAVVRNLEIIGEAAKHVSDDLRRELAEIQWRKIAGMRDMLAHAYFGIDNDILWDVVSNKIPQLTRSIDGFLQRGPE